MAYVVYASEGLEEEVNLQEIIISHYLIQGLLLSSMFLVILFLVNPIKHCRIFQVNLLKIEKNLNIFETFMVENTKL